MKKITLYVPTNMSLRNEIAKGFSLEEVLPAISIYSFFVITGIICQIVFNQQTITILVLLVGLVFSIGIVVKMDNSLSIYDLIKYALKFNRERHIYPYRPYKEYDI